MNDVAGFPASLLAGLGSALHEPRVWFVLAVSLVGGVLRGFSGFGGALIVIPLTALVMGPRMAVPMFFLFDLGSATPYGLRALPGCNWREIAPMLAGHLLALPLGAWILVSLDPTQVRWFMSAAVFLMLFVLISGWRYTGRPTPPLSFGVGATAGLMGAGAGVAGPPVIAYWLGRRDNAARVRTNIMAYYALSSSATDVVFFWKGLFTWQVLIYALIVWPAYAAGLWAGAKLFHRSSERVFRVSAYVLVALSGLFSLPLLDSLLR